MGSSCSSIHKDPESAMKFRLYFSSKSEKYVVPSPPNKEKLQPLNVDRPIPTTLSDFGSKEETFFDSKPWLESDCDDDFFSVNGDFTPSRGSTPVHHVFAGTPRSNKGPPFGSLYQPEPSPNTKKRLSDLFRESIRDDLENERENAAAAGDQNSANTRPPAIDIPPKCINDDTPFHSGATSVCSSERTPKAESNNHKSLKSMQCCIPRLLSSRSFEKKNLSPSH